MSNILMISNSNVEFLSGERKRDAVRVDYFEKQPVDEGAIVNGVIFEDDSIKRVLTQIKDKYDVSKCVLVLDSNKIIARSMTVPKLTNKQLMAHIESTLNALHDGDEKMFYDYGYLGEDELNKGSSKILAVAIEQSFIESYLTLFDEVGIEVDFIDFSTDVLIRLKDHIPGLFDSSFALMSVDGNNIISTVFAHGEYVLTTRTRVFSNPEDVNAFAGDITRAASQLQQFASSSQNNASFDDIYFTGITRAQGNAIFERIGNVLGLTSKLLPTPNNVYATNNEVVGLNHYLLTLGFLIGE